MKSLFYTLVAAAIALALSTEVSRGEDQGSASGYAPVVRSAPNSQFFPAAPVSYAQPVNYTLGDPDGGYIGAGKAHQGKGGAKCQCLQCRRVRGVMNGTWGSIEFLHVWTKGSDIPPLITTSPAGTPAVAAAVLPTQILFGAERIGDGRQSAGRLDFGLWLDDYQNHGVGVRFFGLEGDKTQYAESSDGIPILGVPFFNVDIDAEDAVLAAYPGIFQGAVDARTSNDLLMAEGYARLMLARGCGYRLDLIGGYHMVRLDDGISLSSNTEVTAGGQAFPIGTVVDITDTFKARNEMHGGELGFLHELTEGPWSLRTRAKVTVANTNQTVTIAGVTVVDQVVGGTVVLDNQGTFAQASNVGVYERNRTTYIPELNFTLGYELNNCIRLTAGYTGIYFPHVVMAGDAIDRNVSPAQVTARPAFTWRETDNWVQGVSMGIQWDY